MALRHLWYAREVGRIARYANPSYGVEACHIIPGICEFQDRRIDPLCPTIVAMARWAISVDETRHWTDAQLAAIWLLRYRQVSSKPR